MAVVYSDVPGLLSQAASLLTTIVHKKGVSDFKLFPVEGGSPDLVPVLSAAASRHPQAVLAVFSAQDCARLVQSVAAVGLKTTMMYPSFCAAQNVLKSGGDSVDGSVFASGYHPYTDAADPDVQTYLTALGKYDKTLKPSLLSEAGFADVVVLRQLLSEVTGPLTPQTLAATLTATRDHRGFLSHAFTCDGHQVPLLAGLCNAYAQVSVVKNGTLQPVGDWLDTAPVAKLVG
jgi:ABC-type branched-subunit amino acid transport system substrate-binding protein